MASVSRQETAPALGAAAVRTPARFPTGGRGGAARAGGTIAWLGLVLAGAVVVLAAAAVAAGLAVGLGTAGAAARLGSGLAAWRRRRHDAWPAMAKVDTG